MPITFSESTKRPWRSRAEVAPEYDATTTPTALHLGSSGDWAHLRAAIMNALQNFPEAREAVVRALTQQPPPEDSDATRR